MSRLTDEQMRSLLIQYIKLEQGGFQLGPNMAEGLGTLAVKLGMVPAPPSSAMDYHRRYDIPVAPMVGSEWMHALDIFWRMVSEGILRPGDSSGGECRLPWFYPTRYGSQVIQDANTPYDPDDYFKRLRGKVPEIDPIIVEYLEEALHTFRTSCYLSSAVCLGCASERAMLVLFDAYLGTLEPTKRKVSKVATARTINEKFTEFMKHYDSAIKSDLSPTLRSSASTYFNGLLHVIRNQRNEAGHPVTAVPGSGSRVQPL